MNNLLVKRFAYALTLVVASALSCRAASDVFFDPPEANASISFEGVTQAGRDTHRLEVRRLAYRDLRQDRDLVTSKCCVIYYAGQEYGPQILQILEAISPLARKTSTDTVEIFFTRGVSVHIRQQWKLLGHTAALTAEEVIDWKSDPRMAKSGPEKR